VYTQHQLPPKYNGHPTSSSSEHHTYHVTTAHHIEIQIYLHLKTNEQVVISNTEETCRKLLINQIITEHCMDLSAQATKLVAFRGRDTVTSKTVIDNKITEKLNFFHCLGSLMSYEKGVDIDNKLNNSFLSLHRAS
jgi:phosphoribosylformylglycinamidine (FGAM) synthase PurS component